MWFSSHHLDTIKKRGASLCPVHALKALALP